jgi:hypothetical protein
MPKIAQFKYFVFFFYAFDLTERRHVHVEAKQGRFRKPAKIWIENGVEVFEPGNLSQTQLNEVCRVIDKNIDTLNKQFEQFVAGKKVKLVTLK